MVKVNISRDSWEVYYIGEDQKVCEADFTQIELIYMRKIEDAWFQMQKVLSEKLRSSASKVNK